MHLRGTDLSSRYKRGEIYEYGFIKCDRIFISEIFFYLNLTVFAVSNIYFV